MLGDQEGQPQGDLASLLTPVPWWALLLLGAHKPQEQAVSIAFPTLGAILEASVLESISRQS